MAHGSSRFRSRFSPIAIGLDLVAVVGLVLTVLAAFLRGNALGLVVPGLALGLAVLPGAALSAVALVQEAAARGVGKRRSVPAAAILCLCALGIGPGGSAVGWSLTPNPAADQVAPVLRDLRAEGAVRICEAGDAGRGPDNFTAWQTGFYRVPARAATPAALQRLYGRHGHELSRVSGDGTADPDGIALSTTRDDSADRSLSIVVRRGPVTLQCTIDGKYGRTTRLPRDSAYSSSQATRDHGDEG